MFDPINVTWPFILPPGNVQMALSGGRTSGMLLHKILEANGGLPDRVITSFQNTGKEMNQTLDFVQTIGDRWGVKITWLEYRPRRELEQFEFEAIKKAFGSSYANMIADWWRPHPSGFTTVGHNSASRAGEPFIALIIAKRFLPNVRARFCTIEMKVRTAKRYLVTQGWKRWTNAVGLRADEPKRINKPKPKDRWTVWHPLASAGIVKEDVGSFWSGQPFDLRLPNVGGKCWLGNCDGCFLKSEANIVRLGVEHPDLALWWEQAETLATILSRAKGMEPGRGAWFSKRYTREEMRIYSGKAALSNVGELCQKDDGDCTE